jgi:hypothetical protein
MTTLEAKLKKIDDLRTNNTISDAEKETARAKVIADHVSGDTGAAILQHYKEEHRQKIYPYMIKKQQIDDENALIPAIPIEEQQRTFADLVKNAQLSAERVLFLNYALYGSQADTTLFANWLLTKTDAELLVAHNLHVASQRNDGESFLRQHGNTLLQLPFPLFPPVTGFSAMPRTPPPSSAPTPQRSPSSRRRSPPSNAARNRSSRRTSADADGVAAASGLPAAVRRKRTIPSPPRPHLRPSPTLAPPTLLATRSPSEGRVFEPSSAGGR